MGRKRWKAVSVFVVISIAALCMGAYSAEIDEDPLPITIIASPVPTPSQSEPPSPRHTRVIPDLSDPTVVLPVDIYYYEDVQEIWKVYELPPEESPANIPCDDFERNGYAFECVDVLKTEIRTGDSRQVTETKTANSQKNDKDTLLALFPKTVEYEDEDGYTGTLTLVADSIKSEVSGYGSSTSTVSTARTYPNLMNADMSYIPKTVEENGRTYALADVQWTNGTVEVIDDSMIPVTYTAYATYTGTKTNSYVRGYTVTADYAGEVFQESVSGSRYTVIFAGTKIPAPSPSPIPTPTPPPTPQPTPSQNTKPESTDKDNNTTLIIIIALAASASILAIISTIFFIKNRKERNQYEEEAYYDYPDDSGDVADDDSSDGV